MGVLSLILSVCLVVGVSFMWYIFLHGDPIKMVRSEEEVYHYLISDRQYQPTDIQSIQTTYHINDETRVNYTTFVIFTDEPTFEYEYVYDEKSGVSARGRIDGMGNHYSEDWYD
ncbi:DUF3139 domain-containing protein [Alkalicoccobacillus porphyridii]|nr:DUF3139 domain-containing protein [Alkalicoccobacillus porphyridii]